MTDPSQKKLGVLIHGAGWVASQHAAAFKSNPATDVVAVSSRSKSSAERLVEEAGLTGASTFDDLDAALAHDGVDIVCVCTPQHVHCENVLAAAAAGKHIVIEKPAGNSLAASAAGDRQYAGSSSPNPGMHSNSIAPNGGSQAHDNMPPFLCIHFIIALAGVYPSPT